MSEGPLYGLTKVEVRAKLAADGGMYGCAHVKRVPMGEMTWKSEDEDFISPRYHDGHTYPSAE